MTRSLEMSTTITVEQDRLLVSYSVVNRHHQDAYLLNRLYRSTPDLEISRDLVYIELRSEQRLVHLKKLVPEIPAGVMVTAPVAPFVSPVRAGSELGESFEVVLPAREYREYTGASSSQRMRQDPEHVLYRGARLSIGYYWRQEGTVEEQHELGGALVIIPRAPQPYRPPIAGVLESPVLFLEIPVLERRASDPR